MTASVRGFIAAALVAASPDGPPSAASREVRQLVTFRFLPGQTNAALEIYRTHLAAWQADNAARAGHPVTFQLQRLIAARKTIIRREIPELRVR